MVKTSLVATKVMQPTVEYKAAQTRKCIRKKVLSDGDAPQAHLNARDKFCITIFYTVVGKLETEVRGDIQRNRRGIFFSDVPHNVTSSSTEIESYSQCCQKLIDANPEDLSANFSSEPQQLHSCAS